MSADLPLGDWGDAPAPGPRHDYREALMLRRLLPHVPGPRVLNAGAGAGSLSLKLAEAGLEVTSVDASAALCARVRAELDRRHPGRHHPVMTGDLQRLALPDAHFDAAACGEVLEHLPDDRAGIRELRRVLRPGGLLVATVPANPYRYDWTDHWAGHHRRYAAGELAARLAEGGFADVEVRAWGFPLTGLYHRAIYRRALRRRLERGAGGDEGAPPRALARAVRLALELDTALIGRRPGYHGLIARARAA